jgi:hypothetical protein
MRDDVAVQEQLNTNRLIHLYANASLRRDLTMRVVTRVADKRSAGRISTSPTVSRRSAALALENGPQGNT